LLGRASPNVPQCQQQPWQQPPQTAAADAAAAAGPATMPAGGGPVTCPNLGPCCSQATWPGCWTDLFCYRLHDHHVSSHAGWSSHDQRPVWQQHSRGKAGSSSDSSRGGGGGSGGGGGTSWLLQKQGQGQREGWHCVLLPSLPLIQAAHKLISTAIARFSDTLGDGQSVVKANRAITVCAKQFRCHHRVSPAVEQLGLKVLKVQLVHLPSAPHELM